MPFRTAAIGVVMLAIAARLLFGIALAFLRSVEAERSAWLAPLLATIAALTTTLTPSFELEATACGGAIPAVVGLLAVVSPRDASPLGELQPGLARCAARRGLPRAHGGRGRPVRRARRLVHRRGVVVREGQASHHRPLADAHRARLDAVAVVVALAFSAPFLLRTMAPHTEIDLGWVASPRLAGLVTKTPSVGVFSLLVHEIGWIPLGLCGAGAIAALGARKTRRELAPLFLFALADGVAPAVLPRRLLAVFSFATWDLAALAVLAIALVTGIHAVVSRLERVKMPLAKPVAVLVVAFHVMLIALVAEQAGDRADRSTHRAAEVWTDSALGEAGPSGVVMVKTPAFALRLLAAQLTEGVRPDVLVVPLGMLGRGSVAADVAARERKTESLIRALSLTTSSDEFSLSSLAERRPLYVELDPRWDKSVVSHLALSGVLLEFAPQPIGVSNRKTSLASSSATLTRLFAAVAPDAPADPESLELVMSVVRSDNVALVRLGETSTAADTVALAQHTAGERVLDKTSMEVSVADAHAHAREASAATVKRPPARPQRPTSRAPRRAKPRHKRPR